MNFDVEETNIPDVKIIHGKRFHDHRGFFSEVHKVSDFTKLGIPQFVQDNISESAKGVIRGLHWQVEPHGQGKLVQCISGGILDAAVDIRPQSKTFGEHVFVELDSSELKLLWIPTGFAHGFQSLKDKTIVLYKVTNYWNQSSEKSLNPLDPALQINWQQHYQILSEKDECAPNFDELKSEIINL